MAVKIQQEVEQDCLPCRLVTGFGVVGIGLYIYAQAKNRRKMEMYAIRTLAAGNLPYDLLFLNYI